MQGKRLLKSFILFTFIIYLSPIFAQMKIADSCVIKSPNNPKFSKSYTYENSLSQIDNGFIFKALGEDGDFDVLLSAQGHSYLLKSTLLSRMGYRVPQVKHIRNLSLLFESQQEFEGFEKALIHYTGKSDAMKRWAPRVYRKKGLRGEIEVEVVLQDIMIVASGCANGFEYLHPKYNKSKLFGIPFVYLNLGESINLFEWYVGKLHNSKVRFYSDGEPKELSQNEEIVSLIALNFLNRKMITEAVSEAKFPNSVQKLLIEKLIARRNFILKLFKKNYKEIEFDSSISDGEHLNKGRLDDIRYNGYASLFGAGIVEEPFMENLSSLLLEAQTSGFEFANDAIADFLRYDKSDNKEDNFLEKKLNEYISSKDKTGKGSFKYGAWDSISGGGRIFANREVLIGDTHGGSSFVQLADTFGYAVDLGYKITFQDGDIYKNFTPKTFVDSNAHYVVNYTHMRPIDTFESALRDTPYRNIIVPLFHQKISESLNSIDKMLGGDYVSFEQQRDIDSIVRQFNKDFDIGDTLVISRRIYAGVEGGIKFSSAVHDSLYLQASANYRNIERILFTRVDRDNVKILDESGNSLNFSLRGGFDYVVPVISLTNNRVKGEYEIKAYNFKLDKSNYSGIIALTKAMKTGKSSYLSLQKPPLRIRGNFNDDNNIFKILFAKGVKQKAYTEVLVSDESNKVNKFIKYQKTNYSAKDYSNFFLSIIEKLIPFFKDNDITLSSEEEKAASSVLGSSYVRRVSVEGEEVKSIIREPMLKISEEWAGWKLPKKAREKLFKEINNYYEKEIFSPIYLENASSINLYEIGVVTKVSHRGIMEFLSTSPTEFNRYLRAYQEFTSCHVNSYKPGTKRRRNVCNRLKNIKKYFNKCVRPIKKVVTDNYRCLVDLVSLIHATFDFNHVVDLFGKDNIFTTGTIQGVWRDNEYARREIMANTIGNEKIDQQENGWEHLERKTSENDIYALWLRKLY